MLSVIFSEDNEGTFMMIMAAVNFAVSYCKIFFSPVAFFSGAQRCFSSGGGVKIEYPSPLNWVKIGV